jgi:hypothetical protein
MISAHIDGSTKKTESFLEFMKSERMFAVLNRYGLIGVDALSRSTPRETGETAQSWGYVVEHTKTSATISWFNKHREGGVNVAVILQYGHGTGTGGYVAGRDYINPAIRPVFDQILADVWKQVING